MKIIAFTKDIFFAAKIESVAKLVGSQVVIVDSLEKLAVNLTGVRKIILDLEMPDLNVEEIVQKINAFGSKPIMVGYLSHIKMETLGAAAKQVGCDYVVPRSEFSKHLAEILKS